jgi:hypothetical protein
MPRLPVRECSGCCRTSCRSPSLAQLRFCKVILRPASFSRGRQWLPRRAASTC